MTEFRSSVGAVLLALSYETLKLTPYDDGTTSGGLTVGWGHLVQPSEPYRRGVPITREQANRLFTVDWLAKEAHLLKSLEGSPVHVLPADQFGALTCLVFNIGGGAFDGSTVRRLILAGQWDAIPTAWRQWNRAHVRGVSTVMVDLVERRESEVALWMGGRPQAGTAPPERPDGAGSGQPAAVKE